MTYRNAAQFKLRLPADVKVFLAAEAEKHASSQGSEIVRAVRERMERARPTTGEGFADTAPAVGSNEPALQGGPITQAVEMPR